MTKQRPPFHWFIAVAVFVVVFSVVFNLDEELQRQILGGVFILALGAGCYLLQKRLKGNV